MFDWIWNVQQDRRIAEARTDARRDTDATTRRDLRGATRSSPPPAMRACKSCGRSVRADRRWCLYCGASGGGSDLDGPTA